jgi:hypothetical protein
MLNCREVSERASDFVDSALPWRVRAQMRLHLLMCRLCREYVRQMALVVGAVRRLPQDPPPEHLTRTLREAFTSERAGR